MNRPDATDFATNDSTRDRPVAALATSGRDVAILAGLQSSASPALPSPPSMSEAQNFAQLGRRI